MEEKKQLLTIPEGRLAADSEAARKIKKKLAEKIREGKPVEIGGPNSDLPAQGGNGTLLIEPGKLGADDAATKIRKELAKKMREGKPLEIGGVDSDLPNQGGNPITVQPGKLAVQQWYDREHWRLQGEKEIMARFFPRFRLYKMNDGRLYWHGKIHLGLLEDGWDWEIAAIYNNDHPAPKMGGSVHVVLITPDIDTIIDALGWRPHHLLSDPVDGTYLCTTRAEDMSYGTTFETTAVQTLTWAMKWLSGLELVLSGEMSKDTFNKPDGI